MKHLGTRAYGIRTQVIKANDPLKHVVMDAVMAAQKELGLTYEDGDIIAITEAVVGIAMNNYATIDQIGKDLKQKYVHNHLGVVYPILSRNRFAILLKAMARVFDEITVLLSFPNDEVGNPILDKKQLYDLSFSKESVIDETTYMTHFSSFRHPFTGINMIDYYRDVVKSENCKFNYILSNDPLEILNYTNQVLISNIHERFETYDIFSDLEDVILYRLDQVMSKSIEGSGFNEQYGLLGSNQASLEKVKLFPNQAQALVDSIQSDIYQQTGKTVEVMIYGDGAFKDPSSGIWELADPVVSPFYTRGLEGSPNELKLKRLVDGDFHDFSGDALKEAITKKIKEKDRNLIGKEESLGTTPRRYVDLIGSLCDLMSGSGDKGTPVIYIKDYFKNYTDQ